MIQRSELTEIGRIHKPHGVNGEMSATFSAGIDPAALRCIVIEREGIFVPFFISSVRSRSAESVLMTIDGFNSEKAAATLTNAVVYGLTRELPDDVEEADDDGDADRLYASDLVGYTIVSPEDETIGEITDLDDRTENFLFEVRRPDSDVVFIPVADEYITDIDTDNHKLTMDLPEGLL